MAEENGLSIAELCLNHALSNAAINQVIIGVDSVKNLAENITAAEKETVVGGVAECVAALREDDEQIIIPTNWKVA